jgi:hypothetical protein
MAHSCHGGQLDRHSSLVTVTRDGSSREMNGTSG